MPGIGLGIGVGIAEVVGGSKGPRPKLDLKFASTLSLTSSSGITPSFSRASSGTYFGSDGLLKYAPLNLCLYSEDITNGWSAYQAGYTANQPGPFGTNTAAKIAPSANGTYSPSVYRIQSLSSATYTLSCYVKAAGVNFAKIGLYSTSPTTRDVGAIFNLTNGTYVGSGSINAFDSTSITNIGNGWYRVSGTFTGNIGNFGAGPSGPTDQSYSGNTNDGILFFGAQVEASSSAGAYVKTTNAANSAPRFDHTYNGTSWVSRGLLVEEQRTNLAQYSEDFTNAFWTLNTCTISANAISSPDGSTTADRVVEHSGSATLAGPFTQSGISTTSGTTYTATSFVKANGRNILIQYFQSLTFPSTGRIAWFDLQNKTTQVQSGVTASIDDVGNGWLRIRSTATANATGASGFGILTTDSMGSLTGYTGNGTSGFYIWGAQMESGSFPTSYIPTTSASSTRSADVCQITGSDFSSFWNASEGSFAIEFDKISVGNLSNFAFKANSTSTGDNINHQHSSGIDYSRVFYSGSPSAIDYGTSSAVGVVAKFAYGFSSSGYAGTKNGGAVQTRAITTIGTGHDHLMIGCGGSSASPADAWNGHIARLRYFNKRLTDKQLEDLCRPEDQLKLDLKFSENLSLTPVVGPTPSFSRASTGMYFNSSGVLTSAAINTPRFDHTFDGTSWISKGLLIEEQRTNVCLWSEDFNNAAWTDVAGRTIYLDAATAPDGNTTADRIILTGSGYSLQKRAYTTTGNHTFSVWLRASSPTVVCIRISNDAGSQSYVVNCNVTTSWQRFSVTGNWSSNPVNFYAGFDQRVVVGGPGASADFFAWGAQLELGSFSTSYISTTTTSVVRSADVCQITGTDFSGFYNQSEGSTVADFDVIGENTATAGSFGMVYQLDDNTLNNRIVNIGYETSAGPTNLGPGIFVSTGGAAQANLYGSDQPVNAQVKCGFGWKANDFALSVNGSAVVTDASGTVPTVTQLNLGRRLTDGYLNGHISRLRYYAIRLPNRLLIAKSQ